jgi:hypothetical protein
MSSGLVDPNDPLSPEVERRAALLTAILRSLPLKRPSVLSAQGSRHLVRIADGITARVFGVLNELAIDAVATGAECISDTVIETLEARNRKGGRFRLTALQNWHSN